MIKEPDKLSKIVFGDFQTPKALAIDVCKWLSLRGVHPDVIIEPTCGVGSFVEASLDTFSDAKTILGADINQDYVTRLRDKLRGHAWGEKVRLEVSDFFTSSWKQKSSQFRGHLLVIGNFPWVTNAVQGVLGGGNLPEKTNFQGHRGLDAITGKANFDISEWMLLDVLRWFEDKCGTLAMLVKSAVARKILSQAERNSFFVESAALVKIDAKSNFGAAVDACLLVVHFGTREITREHDYVVYESLKDKVGIRVGHRGGFTVGNLEAFESHRKLLGDSPVKWRSGIKHDLSSVMEFTQDVRGLVNGLGEYVDIESDYVYPLLKGSDIGTGGVWRRKFVLVTQTFVGQDTVEIAERAPRTWQYLDKHSDLLNSRGSVIYKKNPPFSIFGVGDYAFLPWRIAICALYKKLAFRIVGPIEGKPVMFDDTVYYVSFSSEAEAKSALQRLCTQEVSELFGSLIFWDEKRPIKTSILNAVDWNKTEYSLG